jgi:hypothetical protein
VVLLWRTEVEDLNAAAKIARAWKRVRAGDEMGYEPMQLDGSRNFDLEMGRGGELALGLRIRIGRGRGVRIAGWMDGWMDEGMKRTHARMIKINE